MTDSKLQPLPSGQAGPGPGHLGNIRRRFTETAAAFAEFVLAGRSQEALHAARQLTQNRKNIADASALDLCCGPGTFLRALAGQVRFAAGVDITPAMLARARQEAASASLSNVAFLSADVNALPFPKESWDFIFCGYALHHLLHPAHVIAEMARIVRPAGRVGIADMFLPEGADPAKNNQIERIRDPSHAATLTIAELRGLFSSAGLRVLTIESYQRHREFDHWMHVAGREPASEAYRQARLLMEGSVQNDQTGFRPRLDPAGALHFTQHGVLLIAEK